MKRFLLVLLVGAMMASCAKDDSGEKKGLTPPRQVSIQILINKVSSRAIEDNHSGVDNVLPQVNTVTVISYNDGGAELSRLDLNDEQIKAAIWGTYKTSTGADGTQTSISSGASVGVPAGTHSVDVVINHTAEEKDNSTNINFVNYRYNKGGDDKNYKYGKDNFERVQLISADADKKGIVLDGTHTEVGENGVPLYKLAFVMTPALARFEVTGAINVEPAAVWIDTWQNKWSTMSVAEYETETAHTPDAKGVYPRGDVKGTGPVISGGNGFDENLVYVSEYYFFARNSVIEKMPRNADNTAASEGDVAATEAKWVPNSAYRAEAVLSWFPSRYYAIDVESVFINNIKVRDASRGAYLHPWPGNKSAETYWLPWYAAFHTDGWHTAGTSSTNTFLCMGNMWDLTADAAEKDKQIIKFPALGGKEEMFVIKGKALPIVSKSEYYSEADKRNLGILHNKAAAYHIYEQSKKDLTSVTDKVQLGTELPHIIVKMKAYASKADYDAGIYVPMKEFVTIKLFSDAANGAGGIITKFNRGYIYRVDLDNLRYLFTGDAPVPGGINNGGVDPNDPVDPDPERPGAEVLVTVQVMPWKTQNVYPII